MIPVYDAIRAFLQMQAIRGHLPSALLYDFFANAVIAGVLIGPMLGFLGTMVVVKRMAFFSQAVGNAALTGVAIGVLLGESYTSPYVSMFAFCLLFGLMLKYTQFRTALSNDVLIGVFLSISLAFGASLLLYVSSMINTHVMESILFGSILTVSNIDLNVLVLVFVLVFALGIPLYNPMLLGSLNPSLAAVRGVHVRFLDYLFVILITLVTVACVKVIGAVLVEALLLIPAAAARNVSRNLRQFVLGSILISTVSCLLGMWLPMRYQVPIPSGGAIILVSASFFLLTVLARGSLPQFREAMT